MALFDATHSRRWTTHATGTSSSRISSIFDMLFGHGAIVAGYAASLEAFDARLAEALARLRKGDLLILTADHGCDPTWRGTDHTREQCSDPRHRPRHRTGVDRCPRDLRRYRGDDRRPPRHAGRPARDLFSSERPASMPELPEVETVRRGLAPTLEGALIERVEQTAAGPALSVPRRISPPPADRQARGLARAAARNISSPISTMASSSSAISACRAPTASRRDRRRRHPASSTTSGPRIRCTITWSST